MSGLLYYPQKFKVGYARISATGSGCFYGTDSVLTNYFSPQDSGTPGTITVDRDELSIFSSSGQTTSAGGFRIISIPTNVKYFRIAGQLSWSGNSSGVRAGAIVNRLSDTTHNLPTVPYSFMRVAPASTQGTYLMVDTGFLHRSDWLYVTNLALFGQHDSGSNRSIGDNQVWMQYNAILA